MKSKIWTMVILATIAICASAFYYMRQPGENLGPIVVNHKAITQSPASTTSQSDLKDWKTYTNKEYNLEFQYPNNMILNSQKSSDSGFFVSVDFQGSNENSESQSAFYVSIEHTNYSNLDDWFYSQNKGPSGDLTPTVSKQSLNGIPALFVSNPVSEGGCDGEFIAVLRKGFVYKFINPACSGDGVVKQILSTFKFTQ